MFHPRSSSPRTQVTYPARADHASASTVNGILSALDLSHLTSLGSGEDDEGTEQRESGGVSPARDRNDPPGDDLGTGFSAFARRRSGGTESSARPQRRGSGSAHGSNSNGNSGINTSGDKDAAAAAVDGHDDDSCTSPLMAGTATSSSQPSALHGRGGGSLPRPAGVTAVSEGGGMTRGSPSERRHLTGSLSNITGVGAGAGEGPQDNAPAPSPASIDSPLAHREQRQGWGSSGSARNTELWRSQPPPRSQQHHPDEEKEGALESGAGGWRGQSTTPAGAVGENRRGKRRRKAPGGRNAPSRSMPRRQRDWASVLSIGEQQRLGIARVLYHRPALAFLDEAMSAVTEEAERDAYGLMRAAGVTVVAIGHRTSLRSLHKWVLALGGAPDGVWEISETSEFPETRDSSPWAPETRTTAPGI